MSKRPIDEELQDYARLQVRAGLLDEPTALREVREAIDAEMPGTDSEILARAWLAGARKDVRAEQASWPEETDHDRLTKVFAELERGGVAVLQGCEDHWAAKALLERTHRSPRRGLVPALRRLARIDEGMLEVNLWHSTGANTAPGDELLDRVVRLFERHGLAAHFDEGRIEVSAYWHRRL